MNGCGSVQEELKKKTPRCCRPTLLSASELCFGELRQFWKLGKESRFSTGEADFSLFLIHHAEFLAEPQKQGEISTSDTAQASPGDSTVLQE